MTGLQVVRDRCPSTLSPDQEHKEDDACVCSHGEHGLEFDRATQRACPKHGPIATCRYCGTKLQRGRWS